MVFGHCFTQQICWNKSDGSHSTISLAEVNTYSSAPSDFQTLWKCQSKPEVEPQVSIFKILMSPNNNHFYRNSSQIHLHKMLQNISFEFRTQRTSLQKLKFDDFTKCERNAVTQKTLYYYWSKIKYFCIFFYLSLSRKCIGNSRQE